MPWTVILVEPENPGTIGFVARAMNNSPNLSWRGRLRRGMKPRDRQVFV